VARFAARFGFTVAPETMALMCQLTESGELDTLTPERVWLEMSKALAEDTPSLFFTTLRACGALARVLPELDVLFSVPQPLEHHPEGDAGTHSMMVVDTAARLTPDPVVRFSAAMHDLGKGVTPTDLLPKHHGHEAAGGELVKRVCDRFKAPAEFRQCAIRTAELHGKAHRALEMRPKKIVALFEALDAFRKPENLTRFLQACEADARGRLGYEEDSYPQSKMLADAFDVCTKVQGHDVVADGFNGAAVGEEVRRRRCLAVAAAR
jgi:tRNA nucleotidyltransferase (CCA-adding enzyme)